MNLHKYPQSINNICILHKTIFTKKKKKKKKKNNADFDKNI